MGFHCDPREAPGKSTLSSDLLARLHRLLGKEHRETRERQKEVVLQDQYKTARNKQFWERRRGTREASSPPFLLTEQEQEMNKVDKLSLQLQMMTYERDELHVILAHYTNYDLNNRMNELEVVKKEHKQVMLYLQKLPKDMSEALNQCKELIKKTNSCHALHSQLLSDWTQLKEKVNMLRQENRKLWREQIVLQESCEQLRKLCEEAQEICDLWARKHQELNRLEEGLQYPLKQKVLVTHQKDSAVKPQHHFDVSQMRYEKVKQALEQATAQDESLMQMELLQQKH